MHGLGGHGVECCADEWIVAHVGCDWSGKISERAADTHYVGSDLSTDDPNRGIAPLGGIVKRKTIETRPAQAGRVEVMGRRR